MFYDIQSGFKVEIYGKSHDEFIGVKITGVRANEKIDLKEIKRDLDRRKGDKNFNTLRAEKDKIEILSGIENGLTCGKVIDIRIQNKGQNKGEYKNFCTIPRPSTSDYPAIIKGIYQSGSGAFSGRMTAPLVVCGSIIRQILNRKGICVKAYPISIGKVKVNEEFNKRAIKEIELAKKKGDSLGGVICCKVNGLKIGLGGALCNGLESVISNTIFSIPSVKGIEFGSGFNGAKSLGSKNNDFLYIENDKICYSSNNDGGIVGGMANGNEVEFHVAFKPIPSIGKEQNSIDLVALKNTKIKIEGRHDCTIINRCSVIVESAALIAIYSAMLREDERDNLEGYREQIDRIDEEIGYALEKRASVIKKVAEYKRRNNIAIENKNREGDIINTLKKNYKGAEEYIDGVYSEIFKASKNSQR